LALHIAERQLLRRSIPVGTWCGPECALYGRHLVFRWEMNFIVSTFASLLFQDGRTPLVILLNGQCSQRVFELLIDFGARVSTLSLKIVHVCYCGSICDC
jgi:hypothetical protein